MEAGYLGLLACDPVPGRTAPFLLLFLAIFACYAAAARSALRPAGVAGPILAFACLFRATLFLATPVLSHDIERYLWDGRVLLSGHNPYADPPAAESLAGLRDGRYERMDHIEVGTIYPPVAQLLFAAGAALGPGVLGIKAALIFADLLTMALLRRLLRMRGLPPGRLLLYAWNPLAVVEVAWSGHLEPAGVACVLIAAAGIIQKRDLRATLALTIAGLVKVLPFALFLPLLRSLRARALLLAPIVVAAAFWPFRSAGPDLFDGLGTYAGRWAANESLFGLVRAATVRLDPTPVLKGAIAFLRTRVPRSEPLDLLYPYVYPEHLARAACALAALVFAVLLLRRRVEPLRALYLMTGALLLLSPTLHPWYLLWILPWLCLFPSRAWLLLSGLVVLAYANIGSAGSGHDPHPWVRAAEYVPFYALLALDGLLSRRAARRAVAVVPAGAG
jgi:alpha-1,6-mannosyltransferase